ncbi:hypothetical protein [Methanococcus maripaludis]|uniref:Uncharacterized protein n=1 Tax=Methanococcus maripaludis TaxID=39152 RepID=A0A7J9SCW8_METMI|nr:hypothetical protein [Methanococcus maripaludis]MBB6497771.1 hypothetical protein [Methanococcus maripaludis]
MVLEITRKMLNEYKNDPNIVNTIKDDLDYAQKLYFHTDDSLKSIIKFIYWYYATIFTAILAILNFSNFTLLPDFDKLFYSSITIFYFTILNLTVTYMVYEAIKQYSLKEIAFTTITISKYHLDEVYGFESLKFEAFRGKDNKLKNTLCMMYKIIIYTLIIICTSFIFFIIIILCLGMFPQNASLFEVGIEMFALAFSGGVCIFSLQYISKFENELNNLDKDLQDMADKLHFERKEENNEKQLEKKDKK